MKRSRWVIGFGALGLLTGAIVFACGGCDATHPVGARVVVRAAETWRWS